MVLTSVTLRSNSFLPSSSDMLVTQRGGCEAESLLPPNDGAGTACGRDSLSTSIFSARSASAAFLFCFISKILLRVGACCFASTPLPTGTGTTGFCGLTIAGGLGFGGTDEDRDFQGACGGAGLGLEHERSPASKLALNCAGLNGRATVPGFGLETGGGNFPRDAALGCFAGGPDSSIEGMTSTVLRF